MRTKTKVWLLIATFCVLAGCILFVGVMTSINWDFLRLSTTVYETNIHEISQDFDRISMNTDTADIVFLLSNDGRCSVECYEEENAKHSVTVKGGVLKIEQIGDHSIGYIGLNFDSPKITVYLPKAEYASLLIQENTGDIEISKDFLFQNVDISSSTGDIRVENLSAGALDLTVSTGDITVSGVRCEGSVTVSVSTGDAFLTDLECQNLISTGNTGDISLKNVVAAARLYIARSSGDVQFDGSDAGEIYVITDTGDVTGTLLTDKQFIARSDTGMVRVPHTVTGGRCQVTTDTGDIRLEIQ